MNDTDSGTTDRRIGTRRQLIASLGTLAAGGSLLVVGSDAASADVTIGEFTAESATLDSGADPELVSDVAYEYSVPDANSVSELGFELRVGDATIASDALATDARELAQTSSLRGRLTDADAYSPSDFDVKGETTFNLDVSVWFGVLDDSGEPLADATASDTATLTIDASGQARVGGVVRIVNADG